MHDGHHQRHGGWAMVIECIIQLLLYNSNIHTCTFMTHNHRMSHHSIVLLFAHHQKYQHLNLS